MVVGETLRFRNPPYIVCFFVSRFRVIEVRFGGGVFSKNQIIGWPGVQQLGQA